MLQTSTNIDGSSDDYENRFNSLVTGVKQLLNIENIPDVDGEADVCTTNSTQHSDNSEEKSVMSLSLSSRYVKLLRMLSLAAVRQRMLEEGQSPDALDAYLNKRDDVHVHLVSSPTTPGTTEGSSPPYSPSHRVQAWEIYTTDPREPSEPSTITATEKISPPRTHKVSDTIDGFLSNTRGGFISGDSRGQRDREKRYPFPPLPTLAVSESSIPRMNSNDTLSSLGNTHSITSKVHTSQPPPPPPPPPAMTSSVYGRQESARDRPNNVAVLSVVNSNGISNNMNKNNATSNETVNRTISNTTHSTNFTARNTNSNSNTNLPNSTQNGTMKNNDSASTNSGSSASKNVSHIFEKYDPLRRMLPEKEVYRMMMSDGVPKITIDSFFAAIHASRDRKSSAVS
eukprot:CAMPEP_0182439094 /NCGR_PEP_ID=MMETSP1167-20130531/86217_1 /TAXON_ID=2988 /ORGANISM="Mallomonas Sp, Strain CCMP3275" /LENGTH=397 /DNA_ID=CAMNT_0024632699 /DNA_START=904 /DNA_END=2097 /DNA_ORIENTATION=-